MNTYEAKQEARRERLANRAARFQSLSLTLHEKARQMADLIPFGQPVLIGHHSEGRDRRFRARITGTFRASFAFWEKAKEAQERAESVGKGGVSSDDPEALRKLREKLESLETGHQLMKEANRIIRRAGTKESKISALVALDFTEERAAQLFTPDCFGNIGFAGFSLTNSKGRINQVKDRIAALERKQARAEALAAENGEPAQEKAFSGFTFREDLDENRFMIKFPKRPDKETCIVLGRHGFHWSPSRDAWVRQISQNARWASERVIKALSNTKD